MIQVYVERNFFQHKINIWIQDETQDGVGICRPIKLIMDFHSNDTLGALSEPTITFHFKQGEEFLESFAKALVKSGYKAQIDESGEIKRMENHIYDLQRIAFEDYKIIENIKVDK